MSKAQDLMHSHGFINGHDVAGEAAEHGMPPVYICFNPRQTGRMYRSASWQVVDVTQKTDPDGHWSVDQHKTFPIALGRDRHMQREEAIKWADKWVDDKYGLHIEKWTSVPGLRGYLFPHQTTVLLRTLMRQGYVRDRNKR